MNAMKCTLVILFVGVMQVPIEAQSLKGSKASMQNQFDRARRLDLDRLATAAQVKRYVELGYLVKLNGNANYVLHEVSHPYVRPAVKLFIERASAQYHAACGERLEVSSLTRPLDEQPPNASALSVHPAGMSVDFRIPKNRKCRVWLERTFLSLEKSGVLDATLERSPAHYHVAVFPDKYQAYVDRKTAPRKPAKKKR